MRLEELECDETWFVFNFVYSSDLQRREDGWEGWHVATAPRAPAWDLEIMLYFQMQRLLHN